MSNSNLENDGIFYHVDEDDMFNVKLMIIGPKDTPYEDGLYFFTLESVKYMAFPVRQNTFFFSFFHYHK